MGSLADDIGKEGVLVNPEEISKKRNIILIGFMGTGKSSVGCKLAEKLGWTFVDTDALIERKESLTIPEIFALHGESRFRETEHEVLHEALRQSSQIIATGGGAVLRRENRELMLERGWVVALTAAQDVIVRRVEQDPARPLLQGNARQRVAELMERRKDAYGFADVTIDTTDLTVEAIAELILARRQV